MQRLQATGGFTEALPDEDLSSQSTCLCFTEVGRQPKNFPMLLHPLLIKVLREEQGKKTLQKSKMKMHLIKHLDQDLSVAYELQPNFLSGDSGIPSLTGFCRAGFLDGPPTLQTLPSDPKHPSSLCSDAQVQRRRGGLFFSHHTFQLPIYHIIEKRKVLVSHVQFFATLSTVALQAPLSIKILQARIQEGCHAFLQGIFPT